MTEMLKEDILSILSKELKGGLKSSTSNQPQTFIGGLKSSTSNQPQTFIGGLKADPPMEIPPHKPKPLKHENSEIVGAYPIANNGLDAGGAKTKEKSYLGHVGHKNSDKMDAWWLKNENKPKWKKLYKNAIDDAFRKMGKKADKDGDFAYTLDDYQKASVVADEKMREIIKKEVKQFQPKSAPKAKAKAPPKAKAPAKAPAKPKEKIYKDGRLVRAPTAWQQFVKEFSKTYKGDNKDRLKEASKAYKAKGSPPAKAPPVPPPYKDIVKAPPAKPKAKKAPKKLKKKLVLVEPDDKSSKIKAELRKVMDKYYKGLYKIKGYVLDGSIEDGDVDYSDMIHELEDEIDDELYEVADENDVKTYNNDSEFFEKTIGASLTTGYLDKLKLDAIDSNTLPHYKLLNEIDDPKKAEPKKAEPKKAPKKSKKKKLVIVEPEIKESEELDTGDIVPYVAPKKAKKSKKKKLVLVEPKANLKLVVKEKKQLPPCPPKKIRDPVTNRCKHKKKFTKAPSKYNEFVKQFFKENKGTTLKLASIAWKAHKEGKVAEPSSPEPQSRKKIKLVSFPDDREPTPYLPDDSGDDTAITESGLNIEQPRKRKKHNLKVVDTLPTANENKQLADILDSFDDMVKGYEEIYNSGEGGDNKLAQFRIIDERADDYHLDVMNQQDKFSQEALNRIEGAYNHVKDESRRLKQTINNGVPQQQISADTYDYDSEDDHLVDALHVEPSTLDDSNFGVAFAPTEDNYEWDASAVPPLKVGEVSMQNYPYERIYEAPPKFRDEYDVLYPPPAEYSDFRSDVVPRSERRDLKGDIEERVFAKYMEIMKRFNPNTSNNHIKEMWAKNREDIYDLLIDELTDKKGGFIGDMLNYDPSLFVNALEKIGSLVGGACDDHACDGGAYGGELIGRGGALSKMPPKKLIGKIIFELVTKVAKEKGYQNMTEITALYKKHKKRIDDNMFELMEDRLLKEGEGGSFTSLPSGVDANKFYKSGDRFYEKRERPKVFDRAIYDAKNNVTRTNATRTADTRFIPRVKGANREPIKAPMQTDEEKEKLTTSFGNRDLPYQDVDMTDLGDPKAWANTAYDIGAGAFDAVKEILTWLPSFSINVI